MSQAALNTRSRQEEKAYASRNNGTRLAGIIFLASVLLTVFVGGWMVVRWRISGLLGHAGLSLWALALQRSSGLTA